MEKSKLIIANQKNYMNINDISKFLKKANTKINSKEVIICPSSIYIPYFIKHEYDVGIQNIETLKPFTGEITVNQILDLGVNYVIVGHSERMINSNEDEDSINKKVIDILNNNLKVIACIGENLEEKNLFKTEKVLKRQIISYFKHIPIEKMNNLIVAYEPVWTVGTGKNVTLNDLRKNIHYIKELFKKVYNVDVKVVYGGSINSSNIEKFSKVEEVDGYLIGEASTNIDELLNIIEVVVNQ